MATRLDLREMGLAFFPREICTLTMLIDLSLSSNEMRTIPPDIGTLTNLTKLKMSDNILVQLPKEIGELVELQYVDLSQNELQYLPNEVGAMLACAPSPSHSPSLSLARAHSLSLSLSLYFSLALALAPSLPRSLFVLNPAPVLYPSHCVSGGRWASGATSSNSRLLKTRCANSPRPSAIGRSASRSRRRRRCVLWVGGWVGGCKCVMR